VDHKSTLFEFKPMFDARHSARLNSFKLQKSGIEQKYLHGVLNATLKGSTAKSNAGYFASRRSGQIVSAYGFN